MNQPLAPFALPDDGSIPPPPDGSGVVPVAPPTPANDASVPPPPDGSGIAPVSAAPEQGGFADELPPKVASRMAPEDDAAITRMLQTGDAASARSYAEHHGFQLPNAEQLVAYYKAHPGAGDTGSVYQLAKAPDDGSIAPVGRGIADSLTMGTVGKLAAGANAVQQSLAGNGSFSDNYADALDENNAQIGSDEQNHPWARIAGQLLGGLALPTGLEGVGLKAGTDVLKLGGTMSEARVAAKVAVRNRMALVGGAYGAAHGAGSADNLTDAATGAAIEGGLGAVTGGAIGALGKSTKAVENLSTAKNAAQDVAQAAQRQSIDVLPADVGGPMVRRLTAGAAQTPFGAGPIAAAANRVTDQAQAVRDRVAASIGSALDPQQMGDQARSGALAYIRNSGVAKNAMYDAAEKAAGDTRVAPTQALAALDGHITELGETPGGSAGLSTLQGLHDALSQGNVTVRGMRNMRTQLRDQFMRDGLMGSDIERRVNTVLDASKDDITQGLQDAGKGGAAQLFNRADAFYRDRADAITNVLQPLIGTREKPKSGEQIANALMSDLRGNNARAVKFLNTLPPAEQANTRASIIGRMGRVSEGAQNPDGDAFSLPAFLTSWNKVGDSAKRAYFGSEGMSALNDLAKVANGTKLAQRYANHSNTAGAVETGRLLTYVTALPTFGASVGGQYALGRMLASPRFARWLARAPNTALSTPAYVDRLTRIARAEPAISNEVLALHQRLTDAFSTTPTRLAAQEPGNEPGGAQRNETQQSGNSQGFQP